MLTWVNCASLYPSPVFPSYLQPGSFPDQRLLHLQPAVTTRQNIIDNLVIGIGGILNPQGGQNNQRPNGDESGITPEDAQAIWISGFPLRSALAVYQSGYFYDPRLLNLQSVATTRQDIINNWILAIGGIVNPGSQDGPNNQRPNGDASGITPEDVENIWISGFPLRSSLLFNNPVWQEYQKNLNIY